MKKKRNNRKVERNLQRTYKRQPYCVNNLNSGAIFNLSSDIFAVKFAHFLLAGVNNYKQKPIIKLKDLGITCIKQLICTTCHIKDSGNVVHQRVMRN